MADWYFSIDGERQGPISATKLKELATQGRIQSTDLVWKEGTDDWVPASNINGLEFPLASAAVPPLTPTVSNHPSTVPPAAGSNTSGSASIPAIGSVASQASSATALREGQPKKLPIPVIAASLVGGILLVGLAWYLGTVSGSQPIQAEGNATDEERDKTRDRKEDDRERDELPDEKVVRELRAEKKELQEELDKLEGSKRTLDRDKSGLEREKRDLEKKIEELTSYLEKLKHFTDVDFVMVNPTHFAAAVRDYGDRMVLIEKLTGNEAIDAIAVTRNSGIPRIRQDRELTREIYNRVAIGEELPNDLVQKIRRYWKQHKFVPPTPSEEPLFVAFRDLESHEYRVGFLLEVDSDSVSFHPLGKSPEEVPFARIQAGSARIAPADELLSGLSETDFFDYCMLNVAQKIGTKVALGDGTLDASDPVGRGKLDGTNGSQSHYVSVALKVEVDRSIVNKMFTDSVDQQLIRFGERGLFQFVGSLIGRHALHESARKPKLQELVKYIEDEAYAKLFKLGVPVVDREDFSDALTKKFSDTLSVSDFAARMDATHLIHIEVKEGIAGGDYHMSVRLRDVLHSKLLWADAGDRIFDTSAVGSQFHLNSGQIAVLYLEDSAPANFVGHETPPVVPFLKRRSVRESNSHIVYLESDPAADPIKYRTLFDRQLRSVPKSAVKEIVALNDATTVPQEHLMRYLVCRIAEQSLPPVGRVLSIEDGIATVSIGVSQGVKERDVLRTIRINKLDAETAKTLFSQGGLKLVDSQFLLPSELRVIEVGSHFCKVILPETGFEKYWTQNEPLLSTDLVIPQPKQTRRLTVMAPNLVPPPPAVTVKVITSPQAKLRFEADARNTAFQFAHFLTVGLRSLNVPVVDPTNKSASSSEPGPTHIVSGAITLSPKINTKAGSSAIPVYRVGLKINEAGKSDVRDLFQFDVQDFIEPGRLRKTTD